MKLRAISLVAAAIALAAQQQAAAVHVGFNEVALPSMTVLDGTSHYSAYGIGFADGATLVQDPLFTEDSWGITSDFNNPNPSSNFSVLFSADQSSVSFGWVATSPQKFFADAYDAGNNLLGTFQDSGFSGQGSVSFQGIRKITFHDGVGQVGVDWIEYASTAPTPRPTPDAGATLPLLGASLLALCGLARRK